MHESEQSAFSTLLKKCEFREAILDIPCGTGRMLEIIQPFEFDRVFAADYSDEMLASCSSNLNSGDVTLSKQDIYNTTYEASSFSAILCSRFLFHCDDQERLFQEFNRLIAPDGYLLFDTLTWSPRTWTKLFSSQLGGQIYTNTPSSIAKLAEKNGFVVLQSLTILAFPSFVYNFIPRFFIRPIRFLESIWPNSWKTKRVWVLQKQ